jgi:hypothetical protein
MVPTSPCWRESSSPPTSSAPTLSSKSPPPRPPDPAGSRRRPHPPPHARPTAVFDARRGNRADLARSHARALWVPREVASARAPGEASFPLQRGNRPDRGCTFPAPTVRHTVTLGTSCPEVSRLRDSPPRIPVPLSRCPATHALLPHRPCLPSPPSMVPMVGQTRPG